METILKHPKIYKPLIYTDGAEDHDSILGGGDFSAPGVSVSRMAPNGVDLGIFIPA